MHLHLSDIMGSPPITARADEAVDVAHERMQQHRVSRARLQAWHVQRSDLVVPLRGKGVHFFCRVAPFQRDEHPVLSYVMSGVIYELRHSRHRSRDHRIKAVPGCIVFHARLHGLDIVQSEQPGGVLNEHNLLVVTVQEREVPIGLGYRQRQAGEAGPRPYVENRAPFEQRQR